MKSKITKIKGVLFEGVTRSWIKLVWGRVFVFEFLLLNSDEKKLNKI